MNARTALFGGTFDPIHNAHLEIARAAADRYHFRKVLLVPAANPPHKADRAQAPWKDRFRMVELACESDPRFEPSSIEQGAARSYSIDTIEKLSAAGENPLAFLIGADAFAEIETWHRWRDVVAAVEFVVVTRPGAVYSTPEGARVYELPGVNLAVSSSQIRERVRAGIPELPVPEAVKRYIESHKLYRI